VSKRLLMDVTGVVAAFKISCPHCEFDEAEGDLIDHCDRCCRRIAVAVGRMLSIKRRRKRVGTYDSTMPKL
jgi:hypothetical protein